MKEKISEGGRLSANEYNDILDYIQSEINKIKHRKVDYEDELDARFAEIQLQILNDVRELISFKVSHYK
jgi:hypothetical protein